ncbi:MULTISPECIES: NAD(P)-dependent oxidoreductase [Pseudonocardia]|uniref:3-hydroxyisobutyrate dehydrogenase n=2 Tax=Pseudonocardia TaxID=1847 RepID=A0A1Y2N039_PSEAH|nr:MULTISPECIES: NAD(P)-dependent oxidoreductase [Pseudonocardia]OSY40816.1 3-hydroxyisobutyrate dehydrogenase [Pseudonocardia autotrophica]TDN71876.1 3-hydroxyisobutyrate dehydrogenase [Pseudonocardia autotrophica]BBG02564.1 oxidoreductase [Pseudonocardia autotrophica]GEC24623.1 oxidoreductase [Pseudonocardia saturnea]
MRIGIVGLGNMGALIAAAVVRAGFETYVHDIRPEAVDALVELGAHGTASVKELAEAADVIGVVVLDEAQVRAVADDVAGTGLPRHLVVHSTVTPAFVSDLAEQLADIGVSVLDAPVAGGLARARTGDLTVLVGGSAADAELLAAVFDAFGREVFHVGPPGAGSAAKLSVNFMTIAGYALQIEAMNFARAHGLTEDTLSAVLSTSNADSRAVRTWGVQDRMRRNVPAGTTPPPLVMRKDLGAFTTAAGRAGLVSPLAAVATDTLLTRIGERDTWLDSNGGVPDVPRCTVCGQELIPPFRAAGGHPECLRG